MTKEYIDREALLKKLCAVNCGNIGDEPCAAPERCFVGDFIEHFPAADVAPVVHGRWLRLDAHKGMEQFMCDACHAECYVPTCMGEPMYAYCPNCGAKMDKEA